MDDIEKRLTECEKNSTLALELARNAQKLATDNLEKITKCDDRARSVEHRVLKLEGKIDTILDKLASIGVSTDSSSKDSEKIRKNTRRVLITLFTAIAINVVEHFI